ncbi:MAG TPA: hypothetical protein VHY91_21005 [Pirellulales bacterium]|jgi:hypothetical protein|nr:hypothetical protein [Pirellulales bacterium]
MASPDRYYRAALICGLAPLATGVGIFLLWTAVRGDALAFAGLLTILLGTLSVITGGVCLLVYEVKSRRAEPESPIGRRVAIAATALLINFPAALLVVVAVSFLIPSELTVANEGPEIERFVVSGCGAEKNVGAIAAGKTVVVKILVWHSGILEFHATRAGQEISGTIEGRMTPSSPSFPILDFSPNGDWESRDRDGDDVGGMHF